MNNRMVKVERDGVIVHESFRVMTPAEVKERAELNAANTADAIRQRVLDELARQNGR